MVIKVNTALSSQQRHICQNCRSSNNSLQNNQLGENKSATMLILQQSAQLHADVVAVVSGAHGCCDGVLYILMSQVVKEQQLWQGEQQREGIWSEQQLLRFMVFTHYNKDIMSSRLQRRTLKIFKQMARFVNTRNSIQCRSQNQKLIKKHKSVNKVLKAFAEKVGPELFAKQCFSFCRHPEVKYIINEEPPKEKAGHAISIATQTDFSSDSEDYDEDEDWRPKMPLYYPFGNGYCPFYPGTMM